MGTDGRVDGLWGDKAYDKIIQKSTCNLPAGRQEFNYKQ